MQIHFMPSWPEPLAQCALFVLILAVLGVCMTIIGELLPRKWFRHDGPFFRSFPWEKNGAVYNKVQVKKWKDRVLDMSKILPGAFKKKMSSFHDAAFSLRLLQETCVAETVHWLLILFSPVFVIFMKPGYGAVFCLLYILGNLPFIVIQRYNRPRLAAIYARQLRLQERETK